MPGATRGEVPGRVRRPRDARRPEQADLDAAKKLVQEVGQTQPIVVASDGTPVRNVIANAVVDAAGKIGLQASITQIPTASTPYTSAGPATGRPVQRRLLHLQERPGRLLQERCQQLDGPVAVAGPGVRRARQEGPGRARRREAGDLAIELAKRWADAMPWIPVVQSPNTVALSTKVTGVPASGCYRYYPWAADLGTKGA